MFEIEDHVADFALRLDFLKEHDMGRDGRGEERGEARAGHDFVSETGIRVGFAESVPLVGELKFLARQESPFERSAFAEDAAVLGGGLEVGETNADLTSEIETVEFASAG